MGEGQCLMPLVLYQSPVIGTDQRPHEVIAGPRPALWSPVGSPAARVVNTQPASGALSDQGWPPWPDRGRALPRYVTALRGRNQICLRPGQTPSRTTFPEQ